MNPASLIVYVYAVLVSVGGIIGFVKARSLPSVIAGETGFFTLIIAGYGISKGQLWGLPLALGLILGLLVFFSLRYYRTRALMPGGLMSIVSVLALVGVWLASRGH